MSKLIVKILLLLIVICITYPVDVYSKIYSKELYNILERDKISTSLEPDTEIHSIGTMTLNGRVYSFFHYEHTTRETQHGMRRLLILNDRKQFIGAYMLDFGHDCHIRGKMVFCENDRGGPEVALDLTSGEFPARAVVLGDDSNFEK